MQQLADRLFNQRDNQANQPVVILSSSLAKRIFQNENPPANGFGLGMTKTSIERWWESSLICRISHLSTISPMSRTFLMGNRVGTPWRLSFARLFPQKHWCLLREAITSEDGDIALADVKTLDSVLAKSLARPRFLMFLLAMFAGITVVLATIGIYVLSYTVSERLLELSIRVALGARPAELLRLVAARGILLTNTGILIGTAAVAALMRFLTGLLFGVVAHDPATFELADLFLVLIGLIACLLPARRVASVDPIEMLRYH